MASISEILATEFSEKFVELMKAAMTVSFYKYGNVADGYPNKVSALRSLNLRLEKYRETGNTEYLVDVANFAMIEFMHPSRSDAFYKGTDADGSPGRVTAKHGRVDIRDNSEIGTSPGSLLGKFR